MKINRIRNVLLVGMMVLCLLMATIPLALISAADVPVVSEINPSSGAPGQTLIGVVITGTNLTGPTAVNFGPDIISSNITFISDTRITANLAIDSAASPGMRNVTVTAAKGTSDPLKEGFSVSSSGAATISLDGPAYVAPGGGFYVSINISNASNLNAYSLHLHFNPAVVQMAGLDGYLGSGSGIIGGNINGVEIPPDIWTYQPDFEKQSGEIKIIGYIRGLRAASGSGYLAKVHFAVLGAANSQTGISLSGVDLSDVLAKESFPVSPSPLAISVSDNSNLVTRITTLNTTSIIDTTATLNGQLNSLGTATSASLSLGYSEVQGGPYTLVAGSTVNSTPAPQLPFSFSANITGLSPGKMYFCIAQAQYNGKIVCGSELTFTTTGGTLPSLTRLIPNSGYQDRIYTGVIFEGRNLTGPTAINFSGSGVTASNINYLSSTKITATITISANATLGARNVVVVAASGTSGPLVGGFNVVSNMVTPTLSLNAPAYVAPGGGFYATVNIENAINLDAYTLRIHYNPNVIQMAGLDGALGSGSGILKGSINGVEVPLESWTYQPAPGQLSGEILIVGNIPGVGCASGSGYLCQIHFAVLGASGNQTALSLSNITLSDTFGNETNPANPSSITVTVSDSPNLVTKVTTLAATSVNDPTVTLNGRLDSMGTAASVSLSLGYSLMQGGPYTLVAGPTVNSMPSPTLPLNYSANITGLLPGTYFYIAQGQYNNQTVSGAELFFVKGGVPPTLTSLTPNTGIQGVTLTGVLIQGNNLAGASSVSFNGTGVSASNINIISNTQITADISISGTAATGPRDVTVTTPVGTSDPLMGGFTVGPPPATKLALDAPANVAPGSGFYVTLNVTDAYDLNAYILNLLFDKNIVQMTGLETGEDASSGTTNGLINNVDIPRPEWTYQPVPGTVSGNISLLGKLTGYSSVSGSGYLTRIHLEAIGAAGSQTTLSISNIALSDSEGHEIHPANPAPITVRISEDQNLVTKVTTLAATSITNTTATLNGQLETMGAASTIHLYLGYSTEKEGPYTLVAGPTVSKTSPPVLPLKYSSNISSLVPGTLYYCVAQASYDGQIVNGDELTFTTKAGQIKVIKNNQNGSPLGGATFTVTQISGESYTTTVADNGAGDGDNSTGVILIQNLPEGMFTVSETTIPSGYIKGADQTVTVSNGTIAVVTFTNIYSETLGEIRVLKRDQSSNSLGEATFKITQVSGNYTDTVADNGPSDRDLQTGSILFSNVPAGDYTVSETVVPAGYTGAADKPVTVIANQTASLTFTNQRQYGQIKVLKQDQGGNALGGATFMITQTPNGYSANATDNGAGDGSNTVVGTILFNNVPAGTYTVSETGVPAGFSGAADQTGKQVTANQITTVTFVNIPTASMGQIKVLKKDQNGNPVGGATFKITQTAGGSYEATLADTNGNGTFLFTNVPPGTYKVSETVVPAGYAGAAEQTGKDVVANQITSVNLVNILLGQLQVLKQDQDGNPLGGATFKITQTAGGSYAATVSDNSTGDGSDTVGTILFKDVLPGTYTVDETGIPAGYGGVASRTAVTVSANNTASITFTNTKTELLGQLQVLKKDQDNNALGGATFKITQTDGYYWATLADNGTGDGSTDTGTILFNNVPPGAYTVSETIVPANYTGAADQTGVTVSTNATRTVTFVNTYSGGSVVVVSGGGGGGGVILPTVSSTSPANDDTGVSVNSPVKAVFSMAMNANTINTTNFYLKKDSTSVAGTVSYDSATYTATFTPSTALEYSTVYTATVTNGATSTSGYSISTRVWTFTTAAAPPPTTTTPPVTTTKPAVTTTLVITTTTTPAISTPAATTTLPATTKPVITTTNPVVTTTTTNPPPNGGTNWGMIAGIIIAVLVIIGIVAYILYRRSKKTH